MDCRQIHNSLRQFIQGTLPEPQVEWIKKHIQDCPDCYLLDDEVRKHFVEEYAVQA